MPSGTYALTINLRVQDLHRRGSPGCRENVRRSFQLEVGAMERRSPSPASGRSLNTASPEQRINIETREVNTLPTANRNIYNLLSVGAGVSKQEGIEGGSGAAPSLNGLGG